jgi:hypothetical protein
MILASLDAMVSLDEEGNVPIEKITAFEMVLTEHLRKEDTRLFPVLEKFSSVDLSSFRTEMAYVTLEVLKFFLKYSKNKMSTPAMKETFEPDFKQLREIIVNRIQKEETIFYADYDELVAEGKILIDF